MLRAGLPGGSSALQDSAGSADTLAEYFSNVAAAAADSLADLQLLVAVAALYLFMQANMTGCVTHALEAFAGCMRCGVTGLPCCWAGIGCWGCQCMQAHTSEGARGRDGPAQSGGAACTAACTGPAPGHRHGVAR